MNAFALRPGQELEIESSRDATQVRTPQRRVAVTRWQAGARSVARDNLAEETAVALSYNGIAHAVMMATPIDLTDFALGFSLTEGIVQRTEEIYDLEIKPQPQGIELQLTISSQRLSVLKQHRRNLAGRTGCGLCGAESLQQAMRPIARLPNRPAIADQAFQQAVSQLDKLQPLQVQTGACHGAAWCDDKGYIHWVREDVGRHNALDKLIGALRHNDVDTGHGFILISSRASYEMVQKAAAAGIGTLAAVSAPTALALDYARQANLQLVGFARPHRHVTYNQPHFSSAVPAN